MGLHQTWVADAVWGGSCVDAHAALRLLQQDGEDEAPVQMRGVGDALYGVEDLVCLLGTVVRYAPVVVTASVHHYSIVDILPVVDICQGCIQNLG